MFMKKSVNSHEELEVQAFEKGEADLLKSFDLLVENLENRPETPNSMLVFHLHGLLTELSQPIIIKPYQLREDGTTSLGPWDEFQSLRFRIMKLGSQVPLGK